MLWGSDLFGTGSVFWRALTAGVALAILALSACGGGAEPSAPEEPTRRVVILQGVCSSTAESVAPNHWLGTVKRVLVQDHGFVDSPTGDPGDQIIEFGYSPGEWAGNYEPGDTLRPLAEISAGLGTLFSEYQNSEFYVLGHSLGGVVALQYLSQQVDPEGVESSRIGGVLTVSSPLQGLDPDNLPLAAAAIELVACHVPPSQGQLSPIWADLAYTGELISAIRTHDWGDLRVVTAVNEDDRVVDAAIAAMPQLFAIACYSESDEGFLHLNHDTLLRNEVTARELLDVLLEERSTYGDC